LATAGIEPTTPDNGSRYKPDICALDHSTTTPRLTNFILIITWASLVSLLKSVENNMSNLVSLLKSVERSLVDNSSLSFSDSFDCEKSRNNRKK